MEAQEVINYSEKESKSIKNNIRSVADWFHSNEGEVLERDEALDLLVEKESIKPPSHMDKREFCSTLMNSLAGDHVDPVQQVTYEGGRYIGVISYSEHDGYYTFTEYNDVVGEYKRGVCAMCVSDATTSGEPYTQHTGNFGGDVGSEEEMHNAVGEHIEDEHDESVEVETGATLASGTTIAANTSWHNGNVTGGANVTIGTTSVSINQGSGSGLDADTVDGTEAADLGGGGGSADQTAARYPRI